MAKSRVWFAGVPTEPDVRRLLDRYGVPDVGSRVNYEDVAAVLGVAIKSARFREVTRRWRKRLAKENNIIVGCDPGVAFFVLTEPERLDTGCGKFSSGVRIMRRGVDLVRGCDDAKLDTQERQRKFHIETTGAKLLFLEREEARRKLLPVPTSAPVGS